MAIGQKIEFSLGYNFDPVLIQKISDLNDLYGDEKKVTEFFGALPFGPVASTRPTNRIPKLNWNNFQSQIKLINRKGLSFNYLMNANDATYLNELDKISDFLKRLHDIGVSKIICYNANLCRIIKTINSNFYITISSVSSIKTITALNEAIDGGADAVYLDSIFINRDFNLLRSLRKQTDIPLKLYANVSCLSCCNKKDYHYSVLSSPDIQFQESENDALFHFCSLEKLINPVNWLQMQWIRPEDIETYAIEGFSHFKLTDRLAPTDNLVFIAEHYLKGKSPDDLFPLIERNGTKYRKFEVYYRNNQMPFFIDNSLIPNDFIEHFKSGACKSTDSNCQYCQKIAQEAVKMNKEYLKKDQPSVNLHSRTGDTTLSLPLNNS